MSRLGVSFSDSHLAFRATNKILHISFDPKLTEGWLKKEGLPPSESIKDLYEARVKDEDNYRRILDKVLMELEEHNDIVLLIPGHPRFGVTLVQWLEQLTTEWGFELKILPGISSLGTMINDLKIDPIERGTQVLDANRILLFNHTLNPCFDTFIYHVCSVASAAVHLDKPSRNNHIDQLRDYLLKVFPNNHKVTLISSNIEDEDTSSSRIEVELQCLETLLPKIHFGTTLFIPGTKPKSYDKAYLSLLQKEFPNTTRGQCD